MTATGPFASLRARMTIGFSVPFGLVVLVCTAMVMIWTYFLARYEAMQVISTAGAHLHRAGLRDRSREHLLATLTELERDERLGHISLVVQDDRGRVIASNHLPMPPLQGPDQERWLTVPTTFGDWRVVAGLYWEPTRRSLRFQAIQVVVVSVLVTAVASAFAWILVGRTLRPIKALSEQAGAATSDPLHVRLVPPSPDAELRLLVDTLNTMLDRLRQDTVAKEQFYASAAHELRTPLAVLSGSIEMALSRPHAPEEYRETLADLHKETARLITLTESLLFLNRLEMRTDREKPEEVDVADIAERTLNGLRTQADERNLTVFVHTAEVILAAPPTHVRVLVRNLLENAVRYATSGGQVDVSLKWEDGQPCLRVRNDAQLPDNLDLDRLFTPFFRADASRNSATGGNGLGLSICQALARANGWHFALERDRGGFCAIVRFG
ncbi:MAG: HAMP domain-containing sensor histidine kinase [Capsulimonadales bacterium]|nr:HAMP domain-containing sensor histidine kinase [Capsulimonadales bacterium]